MRVLFLGSLTLGLLLGVFAMLHGVERRPAGSTVLLAPASSAPLALIARWAVPAARREVVDKRYLLQGHPGRLTAPIGPEGAGEVSYAVDGTPYASPALSVDGSAVPADTDVVIDRVEQGSAYVEAWVPVEKRL